MPRVGSMFVCLVVAFCTLSNAFFHHQGQLVRGGLLMTATDAPPTEKKLGKVEAIKVRSHYLRDPLQEELGNDEIFVSPDAVVVLKYHGSYMQDDRDKRQKGSEKDYQFMLRLKSPAGEIPKDLYLQLDEMADKFGQGDLRITTRQAWQIHGILKGDLKTVISTIMDAGSSTIGACGDVSRNVMCSPAPFTSGAYRYARQYSKIFAELFKPSTTALTELWQGEEKVAELEYWRKDLANEGLSPEQLEAIKLHDSGRGIIVNDPVEPIYGQRYLPRKFKIAVTVPGDNSLDLFTNDIGLVTIVDEKDELLGFNVLVGGGMGRTHNKETTFARVADPLGFVSKDDVLELCKAILATQRDHGNREVRPNARMKYLVHERGIDGFRTLVEGYFGKTIESYRDTGVEWKYQDWLGWHEQGDGKLFLGLNIEQGRVKDYPEDPSLLTLNGVKVKAALKKIVSEYNLPTVLTPTQSIILKDILPQDKDAIDTLLQAYGLKAVEQLEPLVRLSIACPALPLCGLAITEAERRMPEWIAKTKALLVKHGMGEDELIMRMTGCPNGCARPYMAELALVGDGPEMYQIWLGGTPGLTNLAYTYANKVKWSEIDRAIEPLFVYWKANRVEGESFGAFTTRVGGDELRRFTTAFHAMSA